MKTEFYIHPPYSSTWKNCSPLKALFFDLLRKILKIRGFTNNFVSNCICWYQQLILRKRIWNKNSWRVWCFILHSQLTKYIFNYDRWISVKLEQNKNFEKPQGNSYKKKFCVCFNIERMLPRIDDEGSDRLSSNW